MISPLPLFFKRKKNKPLKPKTNSPQFCIQTRPATQFNTLSFNNKMFCNQNKFALFESIRDSIPLIDAAIEKIKHLIGGFKFTCSNVEAEKFLNEFCENIKVGCSLKGLYNFIYSYLDNLLMYGNSVGEIVFDENFNVIALYNANLNDIVLKQRNDLEVAVCAKNEQGTLTSPIDSKKILFTALNPPPGKIKGRSVLQSLPFVSQILLKIYNAIGENFDRVGNIRFAVTYKPGDNELDQAYAKERAQLIAKEWAKGMAASKHGQIQDFITVGDVNIKAIGADNQLLECQVPARQMVEQIIARLSIPPFMLGLSWSTTERMSEQQAKFLARELEYYRRLLNPTILKIANTILKTNGFIEEKPKIKWDILNFNDQINAAKTRLFNAQAARIELENQQLELKNLALTEKI